MKLTGIVAEYNPLHLGHAYHLDVCRKETGADYLIVIMSGNFVQRGTPAIVDKYIRTGLALQSGADIVLELPVPYALSSSEFFAKGAVSVLDKLGCIDILSFGSECGDLELLTSIANEKVTRKDEIEQSIKHYVKSGYSYAFAHEAAVKDHLPNPTFSSDTASLRLPNDSLAISYISALKERNSSILLHTIKREGGQYHDEHTTALSATNVRKQIEAGVSPKAMTSILSDNVISALSSEYKKSFPITLNDFSMLLAYKIRSICSSSDKETVLPLLTGYLDVSDSLAAKLYHQKNEITSCRDFILSLKSKEITYAHIARALSHILLNLKKADFASYIEHDFTFYARVLGFKKNAAPALSVMKKHTSIPLITKLADAKYLLDSPLAQTMLDSDIFASELYEQTVCHKFNLPFMGEYRKQLIIS